MALAGGADKNQAMLFTGPGKICIFWTENQ